MKIEFAYIDENSTEVGNVTSILVLYVPYVICIANRCTEKCSVF